MSSRQGGVGLIELVITIVILSIALTAVLGGIAAMTRSGSDPAVLAQAQSIAEAYLEEVLLHPIRDPDGGATHCDAGGPDGEGRAAFDDVDDYHGYDAQASLASDPGASLAAYRVRIRVACIDLNGISAASRDAAEINVTVTHASGLSVQLNGYRTAYY